MAKVCQLFSGSKGNSIYISSSGGKFLVDAGVSAKRLDTALSQIGVNPDELDAALKFFTESRAVIARFDKDKMDSGIEEIYNAISSGFDRMYGPGTGKAVCGENISATKAFAAMKGFLAEYWHQIDAMNDTINHIIASWNRFDAKGTAEKEEIEKTIPAVVRTEPRAMIEKVYHV